MVCSIASHLQGGAGEKTLKIYVSCNACITAREACLKVYWNVGKGPEIIQP